MVGQWTGDFAVCTDVVDSIQAVRPSVALGQSISLANSPAGHVLLAYLPESAGTRFQNHSQVSVDRAKLESSLETIRRDGYAEFTLIEDGDGETGVPIWSVAAPLLTRGSALAGVIAILIPSFRVAPGSTTDLLIRAATDTAMKISRGLGYRDGR
jgi:DNA-binding IclR family transcriptional regulator